MNKNLLSIVVAGVLTSTPLWADNGPDGDATTKNKRGADGKTTYIFDPQKVMDADDDGDIFDLDEVVVTGQGAEIQKRRLSANVQTLSGKTLEHLPQQRIDQMLQTAMPNMKVNLTSGQPGGTSLMLARGLSSAYSNATPVIYVDGVRVDNNNTASALNNDLNGGNFTTGFEGQTSSTSSVADIPMENIERIEFVPGGAATTIYGSDAANGVIQIFTRKGGSGKFNASFGLEMGSETATADYYRFRRTRSLLHQAGLVQRYRLAMSGEGEKGGWSLGASMGHQDGTIVGNANEQRRYDVRLGTHYKINRALEYQSSWGAAFQNLRYARNGNEGLYAGLWSIECCDFGYADNAFGLKTLYPLSYRDANGEWQRYFYTTNVDELSDADYQKLKELCRQGEGLSDHTDQIRRFQTSQSLIYKPLTGLTLKATLGLDYRNSFNKYTVSNEWLAVTGEGRYMPLSSMRNFERNYLGLTFDANAQYNYRHGDWLSSVTTAGFQFFSTDDHQTSQMGRDLYDGTLTLTGAASKTADEWLSYLFNQGCFVQENLGFLDRYYLDLGLRADYNSAFGKNVGWQWYPKVGLSYMMTEESWLRDSPWLTQLRLFANYGVAGLYPPAYAYQRTVKFASYGGALAGSFDQYGNDDLGPERKHSVEAGLNANLWGRLSLGLTWYYSLTRDAIFDVPLAPSVGEGSCLKNVGRIENKGIELNLGLEIVQTRDWNVGLQGSLNTNQNKVLSMGGATPFAIGGFGSSSIQSVVAEGATVGYLRGSRSTLNADGTVTTLRLQNLGNTLPDVYGALSLHARWRELSLFVNGDYQMGGHVHSYNAQFRFRNGIRDERVPDDILVALGMEADGSNRWLVQQNNWTNLTNYFVYRSDFLKVRQIGLEYDLRRCIAPLRSHASLRGLQVTVGLQVTNPFAITACPVDPEATVSSTLSQGAVATGGFNYAQYSAPREWLGSVRVAF